jgi:hypothetical protein
MSIATKVLIVLIKIDIVDISHREIDTSCFIPAVAKSQSINYETTLITFIVFTVITNCSKVLLITMQNLRSLNLWMDVYIKSSHSLIIVPPLNKFRSIRLLSIHVCK